MRPLLKKEEVDIIALFMKGSRTRMVAKFLGFSQSTVNRERKKHCSSLKLLQQGCSRILTVSENCQVVCLITIRGLITAIEATKVSRVDKEVGFCDNTLRRAMRSAGLIACEKVLKSCLSRKNVQEKLRFATILKDWTIEDWTNIERV